MNELTYDTLYQIIKYQYDKVKADKLAKMSEEERRKRAQMDKTIDLYNNPSLTKFSAVGMEMITTPQKERERDDPSLYLYNSRNYI